MTDPAPPLSLIGRSRALIDGLTVAMQRTIGGPPASKATLAELHRHESGQLVQTARGNTFEVRVVGPDGDVTGFIVRVTVELDRYESVPAVRAG